MATFVLVHGGWSGGWVWRAVSKELRCHGHDVYTPTLTGYGERSHLLSPAVSLATFLDDVLNVIRFEDLLDVILVAHSLNGPLAQGLASFQPSVFAQLVLLDAFFVRPGDRTVDAFEPAFASTIQAWVDAAGQGWFVPQLQPDQDSIDATEGRGRHTAMPWNPYLEPVAVRAKLTTVLPCTFILCTEKPASPTDTAILASAQRAREDSWTLIELRSGHVPMWTAPTELARLLADLTS
ncbi:esterase [Deinococcus aerolatus]|uniref:Esterase n=1 Tax=Deinococcus aerolatus TaxID=522487 RepID=A0ABQ2GDY3_9DEIO|nr:alpha/beta hydrolase [Deinococcus aerolatus]GGL88426.1 esterase [Deinococcus aerolatus]